MPSATLAILLLLQVQASPAAPPDTIDPALRSAVERFFATQEAEDVEGYLALWSPTAQRPQAAQLKFIFDAGDDRFSDLQILRATIAGGQARVRVSILRARTDARTKRPDGTAAIFNSRLITSLTFTRSGDEWRLVREAPPTDDLAGALLDAKTADERKALLATETDLLSERLLDAMARRADALAQQTQYAAAQRIYERVLEVARHIGERKGEARALQNIANAQYLQRQFDRALLTYEEQLTVARAVAFDESIAAALVGIGTVRYSTYEYTRALAAYQEALAIQDRIGDSLAAATTLVSIGNVHYLHGNFEEAVADYRRSRDTFRGLAYTTGEAWALEGLGRVFTAQGNLTAALEAYGGVLEEGRARKNARGQGTALMNLGQIHLRLGNVDAARNSFDQSRTSFESLKDLANVGFAWQGLGLTELVANRFPAAERAYVQSQAQCAAAGEDECVAHAIVGLAFAQSAQEHFDDAVATYGKGIVAFVKLEKREETARAEIGLSQALFGKKDYAAAVKAALRARDRATALASDDILWRALVTEARATRKLGDGGRATALARESIAAIERLKATSLERPGTAVPADSTSPFALLAVLQASAGDVDGAFETAERRRAHALRVLLANNEREIHRGMTEAEREEERRAVADLVSLHARRDHEKRLPKPDAARLTKLDADIRDAAARRRAIQERIFERLPDLARWRGFIDVRADSTSLQAPADTAMLQFIVDEDDVLVLHAGVVEPRDGGNARGTHVHAIARQKLAEHVAAALDANVLGTVESWTRASADVFNVLPRALVLRLAAVARLVVIPDDVLWRVPFEAMPAGAGWLSEGTVITYAASLFALPTARANNNAARPLRMMAIAAPAIPETTRERLKMTSPGWSLRGPEAAAREGDQVAAMFREAAARLLHAGPQATERAFRTAGPTAALVHFAAPFRINGASPLFSAVLFAAAAVSETVDVTDDGALETREVMNLDVGSRLAVFSDGSAASMRNGATAAPIVQWAWLAAGVPGIVLPRWTTNEAPSTKLLTEFYSRIEKGAEPADALHAARAAIRANDATAAPFHWAGWALVGR